MYKVQYLSKGKKEDVWCYVRDSNNVPLTFNNIYDARKCMRRCYEIGYNARITEFDYGSGCHYWVEKMER